MLTFATLIERMGDYWDHREYPETAVLVGVITKDQTEDMSREYLEELAFLAETAGAEVRALFTQRLDVPHPKTFIGSGKLNEVRDFVQKEEIDMVIFDDELTPSQLRNVEREMNCRILDRTNLILDIFAGRAQTAHAKTQVELAQYQYLLPRLTRMWTHLERQQGGIGMRGPGETEIETDRRIIRDKISKLKEQLKKIDKQMMVQRKNRGKMVRVALVGYTNAGKSTVMNLLAKSKVFAEDKLFATLDTTVRKVVIENLPFLLSDTVGFIRKLPTHLVESFKSTLDEVREADVLIHLVDISHPNYEEQIEVVEETLNELGVNDKPTMLVFNKTDAYTYVEKDEDDLLPSTKENLSLEDQRAYWTGENKEVLFISALKKSKIDELKDQLYQKVKEIHVKRYPYNDLLY